MSQPVAYLRRSGASNGNGNGRLSYDAQAAAVRELAHRHGDPDPDLVVEWGVSGAAAPSGSGAGTGRGGQRRAYRTLRDRIEAGEVSALYAYSLSRLARSTRELLDLAESCAANGVPIRLAKEGALDFATPHGRLYLTVLAAVSTFEAEVSAERGRDRNAAARDAGRYVGRPPFGWTFGPDGRLVVDEAEAAVTARVVAAWREAGTIRGAARLLNTALIPSPSGRPWTDGGVRRVLAREVPSATAPIPFVDRSRRGAPRIPNAAFQGLLRCAVCGRTLSPARKRFRLASGEQGHWLGWECIGARADAAHPRPRERAEAAILPAIKDEVARLQLPVDRVRVGVEHDRLLADLDARRARLVDALENGTLTRADVAERIALLERERDRLTLSAATVRVVPELDWSWPPDKVNAVLSAVFDHVVVDLATATINAVWRDPALRRLDEVETG